MGEDTKIEWCDYTFNPWRGCRKVADECRNCYIITTVPFRTTGQTHGSVRVRAGESTLQAPRAWNRAAQKAGARRRVFCLSLGDWLDDENVPIEWLRELLRCIYQTPWLDWLLLTKRPQNWTERVIAAFDGAENKSPNYMGSFTHWHGKWISGTPPDNVWIGVSAGADQEAALKIPAKVHFLSCEPMLRPMDTTHAARFDWIIFGGESGTGARCCYVQWIRDGIAFCRQHDLRCFVKQLGAHVPDAPLYPIKHKKGGDPAEWPEDLRVREFPQAR